MTDRRAPQPREPAEPAEPSEPSDAHPITIEPTGSRVVVRVSGDIVAETDGALTLRESNYPPAQYIPMEDVVAERLLPSAHTSYCPYKGEASYYSVQTTGGDVVADAVWSYVEPYPAVTAIAGYVAFYPNRADVTVAT